MNTLKLLQTEHDNVLRLVNIMHKACLQALKGKEISTDDFHQFIMFIRTYADKLHHGKEELFLFNEMQARLGSAGKVLVQNGMLVEHDIGRLYVKQLEAAVMAFEQECSDENKLSIIANAMAYADLLRRHIERENSAVFTFAKRELPAHVLKEIDEKTQEFEHENKEECCTQLNLLALLEQRYN